MQWPGGKRGRGEGERASPAELYGAGLASAIFAPAQCTFALVSAILYINVLKPGTCHSGRRCCKQANAAGRSIVRCFPSWPLTGYSQIIFNVGQHVAQDLTKAP